MLHLEPRGEGARDEGEESAVRVCLEGHGLVCMVQAEAVLEKFWKVSGLVHTYLQNKNCTKTLYRVRLEICAWEDDTFSLL